MDLNSLMQNSNNSSKKSWNYSNIYDFYTNNENKSHKILNGLNFEFFNSEFKQIEKADFLEQKSNLHPKKAVRYFLRKVFQNLENAFLTEKDKEKKLQILQVCKTFAKTFGTTAKVNSKLQTELDK